MTSNKKHIDSFSRFLRRLKRDRSGHMSWGPDDVEFKKPDRSGHLSWGPDDVEFKSDGVNEEAPVKDEYEHLRNLPEHDVPDKHADMDWSHIHPEEEKHRDTYNRAMETAHREYKAWSGDINGHLRNQKNHTPEGKIKKYDVSNILGVELPDMDRITSHPLSHDIVGYRGFGHNFDISKLKPGSEFTDHGYTGITSKRSVARHEGGEAHHEDGHPLAFSLPGQIETIGVIHVPKGTKGHLLDMPHYQQSVLSHEGEFTLGRGTKFRVGHHEIHVAEHPRKSDTGEDMPYTGKKYHIVHLHVIGQEPKEIEE